jgi:pilus assembly protein Flp/PilA
MSLALTGVVAYIPGTSFFPDRRRAESWGGARSLLLLDHLGLAHTPERGPGEQIPLGQGRATKERTMISLATYIARWTRTIRRDEGATMVEYALIVAVIALVAVVGAGLLGIGIDQLFDDAEAQL